jgi:hypothetical protein
MATVWGEPSYFVFVDFSPISTSLYEGLPRNEFGKFICLLVFQDTDLEDPEQEPIGVYHYAGIRRYLWREQYWNEYNIDVRYFMDRTKELLQIADSKEEAMEHRKLLGMLLAMRSVDGNTPARHESGFGASKIVESNKYYRVVYRITQKQG